MKSLCFLLVVSVFLVGCGSDGSMNQEDVKNFAPPKGAQRDAKATAAINDFKKRFEATHGGASNAPAQAQPPATNAPG